MSVDDTLDTINQNAGKFVRWCIVQVSYYSIPIFLRLYSSLLLSCNAMKRQARLTKNAVLKSFERETLYFLNYGVHYVPIRAVSSESPFLCKNVKWTYSIETSTFYEIETISDSRISSSHLPYLGASLRSDSGSLGDMSEWIQDQIVHSKLNGSVPFQVLVAAWALTNDIGFDYTYTGYILTVMNTDGEEVEYDVLTGEQLSSEDSLSATSSTTPDVVDSLSQEETTVTRIDSSEEDEMPSEYIPSVLELKEQ